jgi:hypothetical protein
MPDQPKPRIRNTHGKTQLLRFTLMPEAEISGTINIHLVVLYMSLPNAACCASALNKQQQINIYRCNQLSEQASVSAERTEKSKYCTVVENGRVVVKPIVSNEVVVEEQPECKDSLSQT